MICSVGAYKIGQFRSRNQSLAGMLAGRGGLASMRKPDDLTEVPGRAIAAEIGERLGQMIPVERDLPPSLKSLLERLRQSEAASSR